MTTITTHMKRRTFIQNSTITGIGLSMTALSITSSCSAEPASELSIQQAIDKIIAQIPGGKLEQTVDTVKSGDPNQKLTGIVTTFLATVDVIREAIAQKANLIITHEPTYYNHLDETDWLENDPVYTYKRKLLEDNQIVVWRFHDYWHRERPDGILHGFLSKMKWQEYLHETLENTCFIPETKLSELAKICQTRLNLDRTFMVGDANLSCSKIGLLPGAWGRGPQISLLQKDIDVLIVGEVAEWETAEYVRDAVAAGMKKGLIVLGHAMSEEPGMKYAVNWLAGVLPGVPAFHVAAKDPFIPV